MSEQRKGVSRYRTGRGPEGKFESGSRGRVLRNRVGKGEVYFYTSEYLTSIDPESPVRLLSRLFEESRDLRLEPGSDWVQHFLQERDGLLMLGLINHGQAGFPQGRGPKAGPWKGEIRVDGVSLPDRAEVFRLDEEMQLTPVSFRREGNSLIIPLELDVWAELVIGPEGRTRELLFR